MWQNNDSLNTVWSKRALNTSLDFLSSAYSSKNSKSSELSFCKAMENKSSKVFVCCFYRKHLRANWLDPAKLYLFSKCQKHLISPYYTTVKEKLLQLIRKQWALLLYKLAKLIHARFQFHLYLFYKKRRETDHHCTISKTLLNTPEVSIINLKRLFL